MQRAYVTLAEPRPIALRLELGDGAEGMVLGRPAAHPADPQQLPRQRAEVHRAWARCACARGAWTPSACASRCTTPARASTSRPRRGCSVPSPRPTNRPRGAMAASGLGLSICRELATLMGGEVGVQSRPGEGSCFWAELPLPAATVPAPDPAAETPAQGSLEGASVLMVEDNPVNMLIAAAMLEQWGVRIEQASDGQQAVQAVQRRAADGPMFDAVLMDVQMPVMSGHEATRVLRRSYSRRAAADHRADRGRAGERARRGAGRRHERLPDQADRRAAAAAGAAALGGGTARFPGSEPPIRRRRRWGRCSAGPAGDAARPGGRQCIATPAGCDGDRGWLRSAAASATACARCPGPAARPGSGSPTAPQKAKRR